MADNFLVALQRLEFEQAAKLDRAQLLLQIVIALLAVISLFLPANRLDLAAAILSLLLAGVAGALLLRSRRRRALGEKARRVTILVGLGLKLSIAEIRRLAAFTSASEAERKQYEDPGYFATQENIGVKKAVEMLDESAFFSAHLFDASFRLMLGWLLASLASLLLILLVSFAWLPLGTNSAPVKMFSTLASSLVVLEVLLRVVQYRNAARETDEAYLRLGWIFESKRPADQLLLDFVHVFTDYNSAVECAPLIAPGVYAKHVAGLNAIYMSKEWK